MRRTRSWLAIVSVVALVASGCGGDDEAAEDVDDTPTDVESPTDEDEAATGPRTVTVDVDGEVEGSNVAMLGYFPKDPTVRQGDSIEFAFQPGDPHTVTFGTLVDEALSTPPGEDGASPPAAEIAPVPPAAQKIPPVVSEPELTVVAAGAMPCYVDEEPPLDGSPCEQREQPEFAGDLTFYNSGLLTPEETFELPIAEDAAPGTYNYVCLLHGPGMSGTVTVVAADEPAPSPDEIAAAGEEQRQALIDQAEPALQAQPTGTLPGFEDVFPDSENTVLAGGFVEGGQGQPSMDILQFGPDEITVSGGDSVSWNVLSIHTVSFNAPEGATPPIIMGEDGLPEINPLTFAPQGGAAGAPPPPENGGGPPPEGPPEVVPVAGGDFDGSGFFSSGALPSFPPTLFSYEVTFTTPGTYEYVCLIHPDMEGTVTVTE